MDRGRLRFLLALTLYFGWVVGLGAVARISGQGPRPLPATPAVR